MKFSKKFQTINTIMFISVFFITTQTSQTNNQKQITEVSNKELQNLDNLLILACKENNLEKVKSIINNNNIKNIDTKNDINKYDWTALSWACHNNNLEIIEILVKNNFYIRPEDVDRTTDREIKKYLYSKLKAFHFTHIQQNRFVFS